VCVVPCPHGAGAVHGRSVEAVPDARKEHTVVPVDLTHGMVDSHQKDAKHLSCFRVTLLRLWGLNGDMLGPWMPQTTFPLAALKTAASRNKGKERKA
jgi:hypothetical protein